jgi:hypothetical protein
MAGTYIATFTIFNITGDTVTGAVSYYLATGGGHIPESHLGHLAFTLQGNCFSLDGNAPISYATLPAGFTPTTAILRKTGGTEVGDVTKRLLADVSHIKYGFGIYGAELFSPGGGGITYPFGPLNLTGPVPSSFDLTTFLTFDFDISTLDNVIGGTQVIVWKNLEVYGTYDIIQAVVVKTRFTLQTAPVYVGDQVSVTSADGGLDTVTQVIAGSQIINDFIFQTPNLLLFYLPIDLGTFSGPVTITLIGDGTQFSGSVNLGTLTVLYEDASGIYSLVNGQTNDILYFRQGYITDMSLIMLPDIREDEMYEDDFFSLLSYPSKILSSFDDEVDEQGDFSEISTSRAVFVTRSVEIPSPFVKTAFLP